MEMKQKKIIYVASVSHGMDSQFMLLTLLENSHRYPLDMVVFVNTGMEFDAVYGVRDMTRNLLKRHHVPYTEIDISKDFLYDMYERPVLKRGTDIVHRTGYSWCGGTCRWGTSKKIAALNTFYREKFSDCEIVEYVGFAKGEEHRIDTLAMKDRRKVYPLIEENLTRCDCMNGCYKNGFFWNEGGIRLYNHMDRVSCFCCHNKSIKELRFLYNRMPKYWHRLEEMQRRLREPFKSDGTDIFSLGKRFKEEGDRLSIFDLSPDGYLHSRKCY